MKLFMLSFVTVLGLALSAPAEVTAKITDLHLCCNSCVKGAEKAVSGVPSATAAVDKEAGTVEITAPDKATAQKAANALTAAGYFGKSSDVMMDGSTGAKNEMVKTLTVKDVHLCCAKCVKAVDKAVMAIPGVTGETATKGATSFEVTGNFNDQAVFDALQKIGLTGKE